MNLSMARETVAQIEPLREICSTGDSQGNKNGWTIAWGKDDLGEPSKLNKNKSVEFSTLIFFIFHTLKSWQGQVRKIPNF